jgi:hypothetical protein
VIGIDADVGSGTLWELKIKFNSLTNEILIDEMDADGQGHPGLGARLRYRTARLGPSMNMPSMLSRPKHPVAPPALDAGSAGHPDWPGIASSFRASRVRPIQLIRSVHMVGAHSKLTFGLSNMRGSRAARGWLPSRGRAARPTGSPIARNCGARQHLHSCVSGHQRPPALQGAPNLPI